jgi:hypothetical protein
MSKKKTEELARQLVRGSVLEDVAVRFISQLIEEAYHYKVAPLQEENRRLRSALFGVGVLLDKAEFDAARQEVTRALAKENKNVTA